MVGLGIERIGENKNIFLFEEEKFFFIFALDMSNFIREICNLKKYNVFHIIQLKNFFKLQVQLFLCINNKNQKIFAQETQFQKFDFLDFTYRPINKECFVRMYVRTYVTENSSKGKAAMNFLIFGFD